MDSVENKNQTTNNPQVDTLFFLLSGVARHCENVTEFATLDFILPNTNFLEQLLNNDFGENHTNGACHIKPSKHHHRESRHALFKHI